MQNKQLQLCLALSSQSSQSQPPYCPKDRADVEYTSCTFPVLTSVSPHPGKPSNFPKDHSCMGFGRPRANGKVAWNYILLGGSSIFIHSSILHSNPSWENLTGQTSELFKWSKISATESYPFKKKSPCLCSWVLYNVLKLIQIKY